MKTIMKKILVLTMMTWLLLAWCGTTSKIISSNETASTIKIWIVAPLTWPASTYGLDVTNGIRYAAQQYNKTAQQQWIPQIELIIEDGKCNGKAATSAAQKLIAINNIDVMLGGVCSWEVMVVGKLTQQKKIPYVVSIANSPAISDLGDYVYRFLNGAFFMTRMITYLKEQNDVSYHIIYENTAFPKSLYDQFELQYPERIETVTLFESYEKDMSIIAKQLESDLQDGERLVLITQSEEALINLIRALHDNDLVQQTSKPVMGAYFLDGITPLKEIPDLLEWMVQADSADITSVHPEGKTIIEQFRQEYEVKFSASFMIQAYESFQLVAEAIGAWARTSEQIKQHLDRYKKGEIRKWYIGNYTFDENGDVVGFPFVIEQMRDGQSIVIE